MPAVSRKTFEQAYRENRECLSILGTAYDNADVKRLVKAWLSDEKVSQWLIVVDNADDDNVLFSTLGETSSADRLVD
jgi:hypothetical protein